MSREQAILLGMAVVKGCRSIKRAAIYGYCYQYNPAQLREIFTDQPALIATAYLVKLALDDIHPRQWLSLLYEFVDGISEALEAALLRVGHVEGWVNRQAALAHIGKRGTDVEAVAMALYCLRQFPDDFTALTQLASTIQTESVICVTSVVSAARFGLDTIPTHQITTSSRERLLALGTKLAEKR